ncbi:MAG: hypothetical protein GY816_11140 [Cytophagales bacterium]|nr:hypothetical protein [Cytophagales bacterium]
MKKMKIILILMAVVFSSNSCNKEIFENDELTLDRMAYTGIQLRIDGYYYKFDNQTNTIATTYFFYEDGTLLHGGGWPFKTGFDGLEENFRSENWLEMVKGNKLKWGLFNIDGNKLSFERWYPSSGGPNPAYVRSGEILNDTTFLISKSVRPKTGEAKELNEVYHFKEFYPKPDSL